MTKVLDRFAMAASSTDAAAGASAAGRVTGEQYVYTRKMARDNKGVLGGPPVLGAAHTVEAWEAQATGPVARTGAMRESGKDAIMPGELLPVVSDVPTAPGIFHPTYQWLASLPSDPDELLAALDSQMPPCFAGEPRAQALFEEIGAVIGQLMPPGKAVALHRALARIPGVRLVPDAVDAAGRHGIAVTRSQPGALTRTEYVFDRHTVAYLGSRFFMRAQGHPDTLFGVDAVLRHAVVDNEGAEPGAGS